MSVKNKNKDYVTSITPSELGIKPKPESSIKKPPKSEDKDGDSIHIISKGNMFFRNLKKLDRD